jgi:ParB family chromosome partitioning protein
MQRKNYTDGWYTPVEVIEAARATMGEIDLDPASCEFANRIVKAQQYYTREDNGLNLHLPWTGRVWCNPPYTLTKEFTIRLRNDYSNGRLRCAILLVNAWTESKWFQELLGYPICFPKGRFKFYKEDGKWNQPPSASALIYFGRNVDAFGSNFKSFGLVMVPYREETLPGWVCLTCNVFNGSTKRALTECRACGETR